jgi:flagellin
MGFRINTNTSSLAAQRSLTEVNRKSEDTLAKMSSGSRIVKASDDAAGMAISEKLKSSVRSLAQANRNANDGVSMIQVAEGGLNETQNILTRLRELSIQSASDTIGESERGFTNMEYQSLKEELQRISEVTQYNGVQLLNGEGPALDFQVGIKNDDFQDRITYNTGSISSGLGSLDIDDIDVTSKEGAQESLAKIDAAVEKVSGQRAELGALQNRLFSTSNNIMGSMENLSAANSRIRDVDYAEVAAQNATNNILQNAGTAVLAQANSKNQGALRLIG